MFLLLLLAGALGAAGDAITTIIGIDHHGLDEANTFAAPLMERFGVAPVTITSQIVFFLLVVAFTLPARNGTRSDKVTLYTVVGIMVITKLVVVWNNLQLLT